jgi:hypothetical protein
VCHFHSSIENCKFIPIPPLLVSISRGFTRWPLNPPALDVAMASSRVRSRWRFTFCFMLIRKRIRFRWTCSHFRNRFFLSWRDSSSHYICCRFHQRCRKNWLPSTYLTLSEFTGKCPGEGMISFTFDLLQLFIFHHFLADAEWLTRGNRCQDRNYFLSSLTASENLKLMCR